MAQREKPTHQLNQSCLYKRRNRRKLAKILHLSRNALEALAQTEGRYQSWEEDKKSGGKRRIDAPHDNLKAVQKRIANLLQRVTPPDYLMAPVKRRSYVSNAAVHIGSRAFRLLDIEDFFPSCRDHRVYWFFHSIMQCSSDVAALLTKLTTFRGALPQGSPCSPILAYYAYVDMWEEINAIAVAADCKLSLYADDITISGKTVYEKDVWAIKQCLFRFGHRYSERKERALIDRPADITGVIVSGDELLLPNRQHKELARVARAFDKAKDARERTYLGRQMRGRTAQAGQITQHLHKSPM
ncbi:MAG: reverse transcriptase family protein [Pseudomonadota bacterium]